MNFKKVLVGSIALAMVFSMTACKGKDSSEAESFDTKNDVSVNTEGLDASVNIEGQYITYLGIADLNPTKSNPERSAAITIYEDVYKAKVKYKATTSATRFTDLASLLSTDQEVDIFNYEWLSFPYGVSMNQYQPVDSIVDFNSEVWSGVKDTADKFTMNGEHYVAPYGYGFSETQVLMYNTDVIDELGLEDPYSLYLEGKWDYNTFLEAMKTFVEAGDDENPRYGISGWWGNALIFQSGETIVQYDGKKFTNNISSASIEKAQGVLEDIAKNNLHKAGWFSGDTALKPNDVLFYGMGTWAYNDVQKSLPDSEIGIVCMPKDPDSDKNYVSLNISSHMWVKGSEKADAVKVWYYVNRSLNSGEQYQQTNKEKWLANNPYWTEEMYDRCMEFYDSTKFTPAFDYGYGISTVLSNDTGEPGIINQCYENILNGTSENWTTLREEVSQIIDNEIAKYN